MYMLGGFQKGKRRSTCLSFCDRTDSMRELSISTEKYRRPMKKLWVYTLVLVAFGLAYILHTSAADGQLQVRVNRWLEVRRPVGQVLYFRGQISQLARHGMRLQAVGDAISTKERSSTVLALDNGIGFIQVSENTTLTVQKLQSARGGGQITQLQIISGQVRLRVRPFANPTSRLEIQTPAGISGVRGTEFGVSVQPNGKMGVATLEGGVATSAQGQSVLVKAGFQNMTMRGEPPFAPVPLREDTRLNISQLVARGNQVRIVGITDPVNMLKIAQQPQNTDVSGKFDITILLLANRRIEAVVVTPLGKKQLYELAVP
jgi:FecR protein